MKTNLVLLIVMLCFMSGCAQYVGITVNKNGLGICKEQTKECSVNFKDFIVKYKIEKSGDEYDVTGYAIAVAGKTKTWSSFSGAQFTLLLIKNGVVVEEIGIAGGTGSLEDKITFSRKFKSNGFDSSTMAYYMNVKG